MMMTTIGAIAMLRTAIFHGFTDTWEQGTVKTTLQKTQVSP
jgi:hypothetical protein